MSYQDIDRWKEMSKDELYQELVKTYGDMPPIGDLTHIYINKCYELGAEIDGYANEFFVSLHPAGRLPFRESLEFSKSDLNLGNTFIGDVYPWGRSPYKIELRGPYGQGDY